MKTWHTKSGYQIHQLLSGRSNVFLLKANYTNILIDTSSKRNWKKLDRRLRSSHIDKIDYLVLTHSHYDHVSNAFKIKKNFGAKVIIHKEEANFLRNGENTLTGGTHKITMQMIRIFQKVFSKMKYRSCIPDILVDQYYDFKNEGLYVKIIFTPGHSIGSISIVIDDEIAFVGDTMFGVFKNSVLPPYAFDKDELVKSWGILLSTNCYLFLPSHGSAKNRNELKENFNKLSKQKNFVI